MANWYVSQKVASSGAGTSLAVAFKTITEAITASAANDTIYVYDGVYNELVFPTKILIFVGVGVVELNGGGTLGHPTHGGVGTVYGASFTFRNFKILNYLYYQASAVQYGNSIYENCDIEGDINLFYHSRIYLKKCVVKNCNFANAERSQLFGISFDSCTFINCNGVFGCKVVFYNRFNIYLNCDIKFYLVTLSHLFISNNFFNTKIGFKTNTDLPVSILISNDTELKNKYELDTGLSAANTILLNEFFEPIFNNAVKDNYTLEYDVVNNPIAFTTFAGNAIGAFQAASNIVCKDTANSGDCGIYNIGTDSYGLGIFAGKTNVGVIDNANEKLYRTSDGANNWGVFVTSTELQKTHVIRNLQMFGTIIDRNGGQVTKLGSDFAYNYQIDVLVKWSDTLSKAALLAETSRPFVRFRLRPNETNYYVNNSGTLVGDGEPTYLSLVNSSDGGSGSLVPTKVTAKSFVCIIILQDA